MTLRGNTFCRKATYNMESLSQAIAKWIWEESGLDPNDESWNGMMFEDVVQKLKWLGV